MAGIAELLDRGSCKMGFSLTPRQLETFCAFHKELVRWGSKINLTALLNDDQRLVEELFLDSLAPLKIIERRGTNTDSILDIGSGGGFPGIPIKIYEPSHQITLTDAIEKKVFFLRHAIRSLSLSSTTALNLKFTNKGAPGLPIDHFDWAVSKAVSDSSVLGFWAHPHLKKGGGLICMKGPGENPQHMEGYEFIDELTYELPFNKFKRFLFLFQKV